MLFFGGGDPVAVAGCGVRAAEAGGVEVDIGVGIVGIVGVVRGGVGGAFNIGGREGW